MLYNVYVSHMYTLEEENRPKSIPKIEIHQCEKHISNAQNSQAKET